ncbi:hypothetical protein [Pseudomonas sp.]|uniref:hypothetical protein n=1 Tax=Pseudomonas sp. TaxID=306 RepID=UPI00262712A5|nr:hypothetical protein [Pseudomonas sp.]
MSLTLTIIVLVVLAVALLTGLSYVMSRANNLRPHRPGWRRVARFRRARTHDRSRLS